jgi:hypothetical protein
MFFSMISYLKHLKYCKFSIQSVSKPNPDLMNVYNLHPINLHSIDCGRRRPWVPDLAWRGLS